MLGSDELMVDMRHSEDDKQTHLCSREREEEVRLQQQQRRPISSFLDSIRKWTTAECCSPC